jgi:hypothetical protein
VIYFPIDESLSMMQITIQAMQDLVAEFGERLEIHYVLDDFDNVASFVKNIGEREQATFKDQRPARIVALLGGSLGNFEERGILADIQQLLLDASDQVILGVEFTAGRSSDELISNYSDERMKRFLYGPILDVEGVEPDWDQDFSWAVESRSSIPGGRTVVGSVSYRDQNVELFQATKYERDSLEAFLIEFGFEILDGFFSDDDPPRFGKYVLRQAQPIGVEQ